MAQKPINPTTAKSNGLDFSIINNALVDYISAENAFRVSFHDFIEEIFSHFIGITELSLELPNTAYSPDSFSTEISTNDALSMDEDGITLENIGYIRYKDLTITDLMYFTWFIKDEWEEIVKVNQKSL